MICELCKFDKYKLPKKEREFDHLYPEHEESINSSINDLLSNYSKHSDMDARLMRKNALDSKFESLYLIFIKFRTHEKP